jgi:hypothetical protein
VNARVFLLASGLLIGCTSNVTSSGMHPVQPRTFDGDASLVELARLSPTHGRRALLVVYPKGMRGGTTRSVFMDRNGAFLGSVAPGEAALLDLPETMTSLLVVSSVEIVAPVRTWSHLEVADVPPAPGGIVLRTSRKICGTGGRIPSCFYADPSTATKGELEELLANDEIRWVTAIVPEGQAWLDANRARVRELVAKSRD